MIGLAIASAVLCALCGGWVGFYIGVITAAIQIRKDQEFQDRLDRYREKNRVEKIT